MSNIFFTSLHFQAEEIRPGFWVENPLFIGKVSLAINFHSSFHSFLSSVYGLIQNNMTLLKSLTTTIRHTFANIETFSAISVKSLLKLTQTISLIPHP